MCGRCASFLPAEAIRLMFRTVNPLPNPEPSWNVAPMQLAPVVRRHPDTGERHLGLLQWGLVANGKQPYAIAQQDGEPMAFAGLWEGYRWAGWQRHSLLPDEIAIALTKLSQLGCVDYVPDLADRDGVHTSLIRNNPRLLGVLRKALARKAPIV